MYEFLAYRVKHVMTSDVVTVRPETGLAAIEALLEQHDFNALPVLDAQERLAGIVTKLDVLRAYAFSPDAIVPSYESIRLRPARELMTLDPATVDPDRPLTRVLDQLVATRWKSLPVLAGERLVGMISREDVIRALRRAVAGERPAEG